MPVRYSMAFSFSCSPSSITGAEVSALKILSSVRIVEVSFSVVPVKGGMEADFVEEFEDAFFST